MLDFFCSFDGCSMSMSYRFWPSTIATRSSSACVALISMRFIVAFLARSTARNAMAFRFWELKVPPEGAGADAVRAQDGEPPLPALLHHGTPRERFVLCKSCLQAGGA